MLAAVICVSVAAFATAQDPDNSGAVGFHQACLDAATDAVVMNVAAHPDDEAARTMVLLRHQHGVRTVTVYTTCGEGGQNAIGRDIGRKLAAIRVRETLAAARYTGTEVRWLGFPDFGYSKSMTETLEVWGEDELMRRMRRALDEVAPDIVVTNHSVGGGHGHHRASAYAIEAACRARSEEIGRPVPLYQRGRFRRRPNPESSQRAPTQPEQSAVFELDPGEFDMVRGATFAKQAHTGWTQHRTQGPWGPYNPMRTGLDRWRQVVPPIENGDVGEHPLARLGSAFDEPAVQRAAAGRGVDLDELEAALDAFRSERTRSAHVAEARRLLPVLRTLDADLSGSGVGPARRRIARRIEALERVVVIASGLDLETWVPSDRLTSGGERIVRVALRGPEVEGLEISCDGVVATPSASENGPDGWFELALRADDDLDSSDPVAELTRARRFDVRATFRLDGLQLACSRTVSLQVADELELGWDRDTVLIPSNGPWQRVLSLDVEYNGTRPFRGRLAFRHPRGLRVESIPANLSLSSEQNRTRVLVRLDCDAEQAWNDPLELGATLGEGAGTRVALLPFALPDTPLPRVGLVRGPDDTVRRFLEDLSIPFEDLDETGLAVADLASFDTLLLDIRAYHHRPDLGNHRDRLLEFCRSGGRVLVFYHKPREWNARPGKPLIAPFALTVGNGRVSEETAEVRLLEPQHRIWNHPYRIGAADFDGWVQERGLNFPARYDSAWWPLIEMNDQGESPLRGGLLYTRYGRGDYVYCSLALYRQLRRGHAGAARILINLLTQ